MIGWRKRGLSRLIAISFAVTASACSMPNVEESRELLVTSEQAAIRSAIQSNQKIAIIGDTERIDCVRGALIDRIQGLQTIEAKDLKTALYPWFEIDYETAGKLTTLLKRPLVYRRLEAMGVRYVVAVYGSLMGGLTGSGSRQDVKGGIMCAAGMGIAGCLGLEVWDRVSRISASVFDVKHRTNVGPFRTKASGVSTMPAFVIPIPILSPTETTACVTLASRLARYFKGEDISEGRPASK